MLVSLYRKDLPLSVRQPIYDFLLGKVVFFFRNISIIAKGKFLWAFGFTIPKAEEVTTLALEVPIVEYAPKKIRQSVNR